MWVSGLLLRTKQPELEFANDPRKLRNAAIAGIAHSGANGDQKIQSECTENIMASTSKSGDFRLYSMLDGGFLCADVEDPSTGHFLIGSEL